MTRTRTFVLGAAVAVVALFAVAAAGCGDGPDATTTPDSPTAVKGPIQLKNPIVTASGLKYTDEVVGTGASPRADQVVTVHYRGTLAATGAQFDSSYDRGQPATFAMSGVIKGFAEGLSTMKVGGKRTILIPAALAYGATARPSIPANSDLVFELELIAVADAK
ncbi:MAG: FKBP-type peptidyl-prolyl cis-trans isomerase [Chloroflexi bacterium]|nr:FKBP-type peptidyl-prolyl cis-trans isomerase [Chloroflexota bacterium]